MCAREAEATYGSSGDSYFFKYIGLIASIGAAVSVALIILNLIKMGISFSSGPLFIVVAIDIGLVALLFILTLSEAINKNNFMRFGCIALAVLVIFINIFVESYLSSASEFMDNIYTTKSNTSDIEYSVVAQRSAGITLGSGSVKRAGIQVTDKHREEAEQETLRLTKADFSEFENLAEMVSATEVQELDIVVVQTAILKAFAEYFPENFENLDVLATFRTTASSNGSNGSNAEDITIDITKPFIVFVSGLDDFGEIENMTARSDVNMLVCVDPERYKILLVSTPRDYYVQLHGTTGQRDKLTHSGMYGIGMSAQTIEDLYGVQANFRALINFDTVVQLVDSMGGINVNNPQTFELWGQTYPEGRIWLNGDMALLFSRARGFSDGDISRAGNQQIVIEGIMERLLDPRMVVNYKSILNNMSPYLRTNIPPDVITQLFSRQIALGGDWTIEKMVAQGTFDRRATYSMGSEPLSVVIPDQQSLMEIRTAIDNFMHRRD